MLRSCLAKQRGTVTTVGAVATDGGDAAAAAGAVNGGLAADGCGINPVEGICK